MVGRDVSHPAHVGGERVDVIDAGDRLASGGGLAQIEFAKLIGVARRVARPDQTDQDSLPPYDVLDAILQRHIEQHQSAEEIVAAGFDAKTVARVLRLVQIAEFKRKQAAPGLKVTDRAFGTGWRMPIAGRRP